MAGDVVEWLKAHRWWVALFVILVAGYAIGKDMALRDNAHDASQRAAG